MSLTDVQRPVTRSTCVKIPVNVTIRWVYDETPDLSYLGRFTDKWEEGAIEHSSNPREWRWFVPGISAKDHRDGLLKLGYGQRGAKSLAGKFVRRDYRRMKSCGTDWVMQGCIVTVTCQGISAKDSLWGIESDSKQDYLQEVERECLATAEHELEAKLAKCSEFLAQMA